MWLTDKLAPDFKTIANFRKDNGKAIRQVCREFVVLCKKLDLFAEALVAIDGSKFKAVNNRDRNFPKAKMQRRLQQIDESIGRYLGQIASTDRQESIAAKAKSERLDSKIERLKQEIARLKELDVKMLESPDQRISLTAPDARSMATSGHGRLQCQTAVDAKHHLIVAHEVTNVGHDLPHLFSMANLAEQTIGTEEMTVFADRGYFSGEQIRACDQANIFTYLPKPQTSGNKAKGFSPNETSSITPWWTNTNARAMSV